MAAGADDARKWWIVGAVSLVFLPLIIDFYGIVVALPSIGRDLNSSTTSLAWTVNAFMLGMAGPLVVVGRLGDLLGRRRVMLAGLALFGAASIACGLAQAEWQLVAARAVQGVGSAMLFALGLSIVSNAFPPEQRSVGIGILGAVGGVGSAIGPLVGGFFTQALSWRWFFFVNVPVIAIATVLTLAKVEESKDETAARSLDLPGAIAVTAGFVLLVLGIQQIQIAGWASLPVVGSLLAGALLILAFVAFERRSKAPLVDLRLFRNADFLGPATVAFLANYVFGASMFFVTLYLQFILGYDPVRTGLFFLMFSVPFVLVGAISGKVDQRIGLRQALAAGMLWLALAFALLALIEPASGPAPRPLWAARRGRRPGPRLQSLDHGRHGADPAGQGGRGLGRAQHHPHGRPRGRRGAHRRAGAQPGIRPADRPAVGGGSNDRSGGAGRDHRTAVGLSGGGISARPAGAGGRRRGASRSPARVTITGSKRG